MAIKNFRPLFFCLIATILLNNTNCQTYYQKITHVSYTDIDGNQENTNFHNLEIQWSTSDISGSSPTAGSWNYLINRSDTNQSGTADNNSSTFNERYSVYLPDIAGTHSKYPVVWDLAASCNTGTTTITAKVKYFTCLDSANDFYDSNSSTEKAKLYDPFTTTNLTLSYGSQSSVPVSKLMGRQIDTALINECT